MARRLPSQPGIMRRTRFLMVVLLSSIFCGGAGRLLAADAILTVAERQARVRTTDTRLRRLVDQGARESPTFRTLVDRLNASDVVVYLHCEVVNASRRVDGRLVFVAAAGGFRYVVVRLAWLVPRERQIAILAHELQHAVEIAETPAIVDRPSLAREYARIGFVSSRTDVAGMAFETVAAAAVGERVLRELGVR
jgi:hypothetical protein